MTPERIKELKAICDAATPGPWLSDVGNVVGKGKRHISTGSPLADAQFIASARTALPEALDEIERLNQCVRAKIGEKVIDG